MDIFERTPMVIRKRKLQGSIEKTTGKEGRPKTRELLSLNSKEIGRRVSQELTKHTSRELSQATSRFNFRNPLLKLTDRPILSKLTKKSTMLEHRKPIRSRTRMKSEINNYCGSLKKPQKDVRRLV